MITEIAYQLVKNLSFIDKWVGLAIPMRKMIEKKEKIFPVAYNIDPNCDVSEYTDLVPDSKKSAICYCEKINEITFEQIRKNYFIASTDLRIVLWYNLNRITEGDYIDEGIMAANLLAKIPRTLSNSLFTYVSSVNIFPSGAMTGALIFSKYTYEEVRTQFVTHPYGAVAVDVNIQYVINKCVEELIPGLKCNVI